MLARKCYNRLYVGEIERISSCKFHLRIFDGFNFSTFAFLDLYRSTVSQPINGIENRGHCPIDIEVISKNNRRDYGYIDFNYESNLTLNSVLSCNGFLKESNGLANCQAYVGLNQRIKFDHNVSVSHNEACQIKQGKLLGEFFFKPLARRCLYKFKSSRGVFRLVTLGYEVVQ